MSEVYPAAEAYGAVAGEMYIPGEDGYQSPADVIETLDPAIVKVAQTYAEAMHLPWPPIASGSFGWVGELTFDPTPVRVEIVGNTTVYHLDEEETPFDELSDDDKRFAADGWLADSGIR